MTARFLLHLRAWDHAAHHPATGTYSTFDSALNASPGGGGVVRSGSMAFRAPQRPAVAVGKRRSWEGGVVQDEAGNTTHNHAGDGDPEAMELRSAPLAPPGALLSEAPPAGRGEFIHAI